MSIKAQALLVRAILERHNAYDWTSQGMGFMRMKLGDARINVWDSVFRQPNVSDIHSHPWPLKSTIVSGMLINQRFEEQSAAPLPGCNANFLPYHSCSIQTGEGGGLKGDVRDVWLEAHRPDLHVATEDAVSFYGQDAAEIHRSIYEDGTVTLIERPVTPSSVLAKVYWPSGTVWVTAEPKPVQPYDQQMAIKRALDRWTSVK